MFPLHLLHVSRYFADRGDRGTPLNYHIQFGMHDWHYHNISLLELRWTIVSFGSYVLLPLLLDLFVFLYYSSFFLKKRVFHNIQQCGHFSCNIATSHVDLREHGKQTNKQTSKQTNNKKLIVPVGLSLLSIRLIYAGCIVGYLILKRPHDRKSYFVTLGGRTA